MAKAKSVWGIDIGQCALKALKIGEVEGEIQVQAFETIEHPKILSQPDADRRELVRQALEQFLATHNVKGSILCVGVPGQISFTKFVKLPPVETKRIPDIVRFEAEQQIPFPIDEVIWQWQTFQDPDSPDVEVGIFAMKRGDIYDTLDHFTDLNLNVDRVQMAPLALYNYMMYDNQLAEEGATLLADVGADKTDLVVADNQKLWIRTIQIGGNNFTEALVKAFKLSFAKAEKLKRTAVTSKYAKQIFQAMRPVFADLVQEIQRSIGFYTTTHRDTRFKRLMGLGNGFRLPGLERFLEQNLNIQVARVDSYNNLSVAAGVNAPAFNENVLSYAVAYGLALQGVDRSAVRTNMLPLEISRRRQWRAKQPWFAAAAAVVLAALAGPIYRSYADLGVLENTTQLEKARAQVQKMEANVNEFRTYVGKGDQDRKQIDEAQKLFAYRTFWPRLQDVILGSLGEVALNQGELVNYATWLEAKSALAYQLQDLKIQNRETKGKEQEIAQVQQQLNQIKANIDNYSKVPRNKRRQVFVDSLESMYYPDLAVARLNVTVTATGALPSLTAGLATHSPTAAAGASSAKRGFLVRLVGRTTVSQRDAMAEILSPLQKRTAELFKESPEFRLLDEWPTVTILPSSERGSGSSSPGRGAVPSIPMGMEGMEMMPMPGPDMMPAPMVPSPGGTTAKDVGPVRPDPLLPTEDMVNDTRFAMHWLVVVESDGLQVAPPAKSSTSR